MVVILCKSTVLFFIFFFRYFLKLELIVFYNSLVYYFTIINLEFEKLKCMRLVTSCSNMCSCWLLVILRETFFDEYSLYTVETTKFRFSNILSNRFWWTIEDRQRLSRIIDIEISIYRSIRQYIWNHCNEMDIFPFAY